MTQPRSRRAPLAHACQACARKRHRGAAPGDVPGAIRDAEPAIIDAIIAKALEGSCQHAKFLFDHVGLTHQPTPEQNEPSLAQVLLERLGLDQETPQAAGNGDYAGNHARIQPTGDAPPESVY